jgi:hypothetical protein
MRIGHRPSDERDSSREDGDSRGEATSYPRSRLESRRRHPAARLIPFAFMAAIGLLIAREEIPAVKDWWEQTFDAKTWRIREICRNAVLEDLGSGRYARLVQAGDVHNTKDGTYVKELRMAILGADGDEEMVEYNCYLDSDGRLFKLVGHPQGNR